MVRVDKERPLCKGVQQRWAVVIPEQRAQPRPMGLIQFCPEDDAEEPSLAKLETVGDARRKNYLAKALARARMREEEKAARWGRASRHRRASMVCQHHCRACMWCRCPDAEKFSALLGHHLVLAGGHLSCGHVHQTQQAPIVDARSPWGARRLLSLHSPPFPPPLSCQGTHSTKPAPTKGHTSS